ncbi:MAG: RNA methyltransferase [Bacteroidales bacterium]
MLSKNKIKFINRLKKKKERNEKKLFLAEGEKIVLEMLSSNLKTELLAAEEEFIKKLTDDQIKKIHELVTVNASELKQISSLKTPNKVVAVIQQPSFNFQISEIQDSLSLGLDAINDPGNLGTILRIADWFGIYDIFCSQDTVDVFNPKTVQATMGAISRVRVHYINLREIIKNLKTENNNFQVYGCFLKGQNIYKARLGSTGLVIMGSESHGISKSLEDEIDHKLFIPSFSPGAMISPESLNASIATGIVCSEFRRRKY